MYFIVPEMKGLTIEQLDYLYDQDVATLKFKGYRFASQVIDGEDVSVVNETVDIKAAGGEVKD